MASIISVKYALLYALAKLASDLQLNVTSLLFPNASPFVKWESEFIKSNLPLLSGFEFNSNNIVSLGNLAGSPTIANFIWSAAQGTLSVTFSTTLTGNAQNTDSVIITLVKRDCSEIYSRIDEDNTRVFGQSVLNPLVHLGVDLDPFVPADWVAFVTFHRWGDLGATISLCSNSQGGNILT